ncbi:hypothetical protein ACPOL_5324 [Acidisarcina polymorpha]|uniref:Uncharacterized protein n=1 Tax=Acidisarcina polymorpha TaxID=2211140 RepID=A0A2Z5G795_9BACT|nr:hypothetical protein ACPOL_5324 [Acidisarcina polymorpha]
MREGEASTGGQSEQEQELLTHSEDLHDEIAIIAAGRSQRKWRRSSLRRNSISHDEPGMLKRRSKMPLKKACEKLIKPEL